MIEREEIRETDRDESPAERVDRNFNELLGELRIALPGVQVLFAFLLTVPFQQRFQSATSFEKNVYFVTLCSTAVASMLLIAPSAYHRVEFRLQDKAHIVQVANRFAVAGFLFLGVGMTGAILLVTNYLFSTTASIVVTACAAALFLTLWYLLPIRRRIIVIRQGRD